MTDTAVHGGRPLPWPRKAASGYLLVDVKKCQGCLSCMMACSLVHEGLINLSLSRIQVIQNSFARFPEDLTVEQCRQCLEPACVEACLTGALKPRPAYGNVRMVDPAKCIGCGECIEACPYPPSRTVWDPASGRASKCDLCAEASHWQAAGGPGGRQACIEVCPLGAIGFTTQTPQQIGESGYKVNLRDQAWDFLGYSKT